MFATLRFIGILAAPVLLAAVVAPAHATLLGRHWGDTNPTAEGCSEVEIDTVGTLGVDANAGPVDDGGIAAWQINDNLTSGSYDLPTYEIDISSAEFHEMFIKGWELSFTSRFVGDDAGPLEIGFNVQSSLNPWNTFYETYRVTLDDDGDHTLVVGAGGSGSQDSGVDPFSYHTIRMAAGPKDATFDVFVDDTKLFSDAIGLNWNPRSELRNSVFFGTNTSAGRGHVANFRAVRLHAIPEPAALLVWAGVGVSFLALRRRRRR